MDIEQNKAVVRGFVEAIISIYRVADGRIAEAWVEWDCLNGLVQLGHISLPLARLDTTP